MVQLHCTNAWFIVFLDLIVGCWALLTLKWKKLEQPSLWWSIAVAQALTLLQVLVGIYLRTVAGLGVKNFHIFYGVVSVITVALAYIYVKGNDWVKERRMAFYGVVSLFLMGVALRAIYQAGPRGCSPF